MKIRIIPSILTDGRSQVKGSHYDNWRTVGSVIQAIKVQSLRDVDEIALLDVNASREERIIELALIEKIAEFLRVPLTVGGGISSSEHFSNVLAAGADKVVIGHAAVANRDLIGDLAAKFGSQAIVVSIDSKKIGNAKGVAILSGMKHFPIPPVELALEMQQRGAGEILLQNVDRDGTLEGLDIALIKELCNALTIPVLASSGLSSVENAVQAAQAGASAIVAGAVLQFTQVTPATIKAGLKEAGFEVRN